LFIVATNSYFAIRFVGIFFVTILIDMNGKDANDTPLGSDELENLLSDGGKSFYKDQKALAIFIRRVAVTIKLYRQQLRKVNSDMSALREDISSGGRATSLNPLDAVRFLSPEQLLSLVDNHMQGRVKATEAAWATALESQERNKVFVLRITSLLKSLDKLDQESRNKVEVILAELEGLPLAKAPNWVLENEVEGGLDDLFKGDNNV
jgi:hypothetical protein